MSTIGRAIKTPEVKPTEEPAPRVTVDEALSALTPDLQDTLAELDGAPDRLAELVVGLLPDDTARDALFEYGIVESTPMRTATSHRSERLSVTPFGRHVIEACAVARSAVRPAADAADLEHRAERLRRRLQADSLPMETREARR